MRKVLLLVLTTAWIVLPFTAGAGDWPQWGGTSHRNMVSTETGLPDLRPPSGQAAVYLSEAGCPYVKWKAAIGSTTWGNPTVAAGRVYVGTSGPGRKGGLVKCLDAATGNLLWQLHSPARDFPVPERPQRYPKYSPWDLLVATHAQVQGWGVCSSTSVDGDRAYVLTQRGEVLCLDVQGMANGNDGPFHDEAQYQRDEGRADFPAASESADILWLYDLWTEVKTRPADTFSNAALIHGNVLYISTCNGIERWPNWHGKPAAPPNPDAPNLIALDKHTGRLLATDDTPIGKALLHGQWSPPSLGKVNGKTLIFYGGGDGVCYAFEALDEVPDKPVKLKTVWSYDCNPPEYKGIGVENYSLGDKDVVRDVMGDSKAVAAELARHYDRDKRLLSMSEIIGSPVFHQNRVYVAIGRDPRHGPGRGALHAIDATKTGDITRSGRVWCYDAIDRSLSTPSVADGLVYAADLTGRLHCLDADTGRCYWTHDTRQETWGSTLAADGKVYLVTRRSFHVLAAGKEKKEYSAIRMGADCSPIAADGVLYVVLRGTLYALQDPSLRAAPAAQPGSQPTVSSPRMAGPTSEALDWPCWRGPNGDGFSPEVPQRLPPKKLAWSQEMAGECHAPISVGEGCAVLGDHDSKRDFWRCFDAAGGGPRWTFDYTNAEKMEFGAAPRAAPLIHGGKAYCLSAWGELFCFKLADGHVAWRKHLGRQSGQKTPQWGFCVSPRIAGGKLIVSPGADRAPFSALEPETGEVVWTAAGKGVNYASTLIGTFGGVPQVVAYDAATAGGWDLGTGRRLWTLKVDCAAGYIVPSPVALGQRILLASGEENSRLLGFGPAGTLEPQPQAVNEDLAPEIATPTAWGDAILGAAGGLMLLDASAAPGKGLLRTLWISDKDEYLNGVCHAIVSHDRALVMCEDGQVLLLAADRNACRVLDRQKLCDKTWSHPALARGRLYVRDKSALYCYDLRIPQ